MTWVKRWLIPYIDIGGIVDHQCFSFLFMYNGGGKEAKTDSYNDTQTIGACLETLTVENSIDVNGVSHVIRSQWP